MTAYVHCLQSLLNILSMLSLLLQSDITEIGSERLIAFCRTKLTENSLLCLDHLLKCCYQMLSKMFCNFVDNTTTGPPQTVIINKKFPPKPMICHGSWDHSAPLGRVSKYLPAEISNRVSFSVSSRN